MRRFHFLRGALVAALCLTAVGCGSKLVKVTGKVILDDRPVEGAVVVFQGENGAGNPAAGQTDSEGVFHLGTFQSGDGAFPGEYKVLIVPPGHVTDIKPEAPGMAAAMAAFAKIEEERRTNPNYPFGHEIAAIYRDPSNTPLKATVPPGGRVVFEVKADPNPKKRPVKEGTNPMEPPRPRKKR